MFHHTRRVRSLALHRPHCRTGQYPLQLLRKPPSCPYQATTLVDAVAPRPLTSSSGCWPRTPLPFFLLRFRSRRLQSSLSSLDPKAGVSQEDSGPTLPTRCFLVFVPGHGRLPLGLFPCTDISPLLRAPHHLPIVAASATATLLALALALAPGPLHRASLYSAASRTRPIQTFDDRSLRALARAPGGRAAIRTTTGLRDPSHPLLPSARVLLEHGWAYLLTREDSVLGPLLLFEGKGTARIRLVDRGCLLQGDTMIGHRASTTCPIIGGGLLPATVHRWFVEGRPLQSERDLW